MGPDQSASGETWRPFDFAGPRPLLAFLVAFSALVLASTLRWDALFDVDASLDTAPLLLFNGRGAASSTLQFGLATLFVWSEDVRLRDIGLAPRLLAPTLAVGAAVVVALNVAVAGLGLTAGNSLSQRYRAEAHPL